MARITATTGRELLTTGDYSDFKIECSDGTEHNVHKLILGTSSTYFRLMFRNPFQEYASSCVSLNDHDPVTISQMIDFIYTGSYKEPHGTGTALVERHQAAREIVELDPEQLFDTLKSSILLPQAADYFDVDGLSKIVIGRVNLLIEYGDHDNGKHFADMLTLMYETTSKSDTALTAFVTQRFIISPKLRKYEGFEAARQVIEEYEPLAYAVCLSMRKELLKQEGEMKELEYKLDKRLKSSRT